MNSFLKQVVCQLCKLQKGVAEKMNACKTRRSELNFESYQKIKNFETSSDCVNFKSCQKMNTFETSVCRLCKLRKLPEDETLNKRLLIVNFKSCQKMNTFETSVCRLCKLQKLPEDEL
ncbi:hypothetical protein AVEN_157055-1 [Araneus ventricosus]|uniref:Uncharacterized protein n=1 Tax=Araneus ventricosus TaxID=182803 RepID=A0A4Y1ZW11_ARAVE|nr:hypothetical protein AVEN_157055-1 [Araneus ventricosus]